MKKMILTAGQKIKKKEINYVLDAVKTGWNENWARNKKKFETSFAKYSETKYAIATSSCTGAMHLALLALGIKKGDEVIMPDLGWVATSAAVKYTGAEPVFVDVLEDTWCIDPDAIKKAITKRTKAIMPVHLYGHTCEMDEINRIAKKYNLYVIEDAAQSIGSIYKNRRPGSLSDIGCFSFQGAKIMVTGEGGMLVTNDEKLYAKARFYNDHGRDPKGSFWIFEVGYKYKMSNLQAALGLAQLERIKDLVDKKRLVFKWYKERLNKVNGLQLNDEKKYVRSNFWMSSIVLNGKFKINRDELMKILKEKYFIDSRTFYYPISEFKPYRKRYSNPTTKKLAMNGINLPSGYNLTEKQINYISSAIKKVIDK